MSGVYPRCDDCGQLLYCETDWLGRMYYLHSKPCVSRVARRYKVNCTGCGKQIEIEKRPRSDVQYSCGERCSVALKIKRQAARRADVFARWFRLDEIEQQQGVA